MHRTFKVVYDWAYGVGEALITVRDKSFAPMFNELIERLYKITDAREEYGVQIAYIIEVE